MRFFTELKVGETSILHC